MDLEEVAQAAPGGGQEQLPDGCGVCCWLPGLCCSDIELEPASAEKPSDQPPAPESE